MSDAGTGTERHLDDERLSALIDGAAGEEDRAHAAACPQCSARLAAWREVVGRVAALGDQPLSAMADSRREAVVNRVLATAERRRSPFRPAWLVAAAVLAVVGAGVGFGLSRTGAGTHHVSSAASPSSSAASPTPSAASSANQPSGGAAATPTIGATVDLGDIGSPGALVAAIRGGSGPPASISFTCLAAARSQAGAGSDAAPTRSAELSYQGVPAQAFVFPVGGHHVVVASQTATCAPLVRTTY